MATIRKPSKATLMAQLLRAYYTAQEKEERAEAALKKAVARRDAAGKATEVAAKACEDAGFTVGEPDEHTNDD